MKIRVGTLRQLIREAILEAGGGITMPTRPMVRNPMAPSMSDREQIGKNSLKNIDDDEEIAPHLIEPTYNEEDCWGPVPPTGDNNPHASMDFYNTDFNVIPRTPIIR